MRRRKVISPIRNKTVLNYGNLKNDNMNELRSFYNMDVRQAEREVREVGAMSGSDPKVHRELYNMAYDRKK